MKYKVIGWVGYDDSEWEDGDASDAIVEAICDDIKENGFEFSGYYHQEGWAGAPVLNDGKRYCFSQRGWGGIMAQAHGFTGFMDYAIYAFSARKEGETPDGEIDESLIVARETLSQKFSLEITADEWEKAKTKKEITIINDDKYRFIDKGDTLEVAVDGNIYQCAVTSVQHWRNISDKERNFLYSYDPSNERESQKAKKLWDDATIFLSIGIKLIKQ